MKKAIELDVKYHVVINSGIYIESGVVEALGKHSIAFLSAFSR